MSKVDVDSDEKAGVPSAGAHACRRAGQGRPLDRIAVGPKLKRFQDWKQDSRQKAWHGE